MLLVESLAILGADPEVVMTVAGALTAQGVLIVEAEGFPYEDAFSPDRTTRHTRRYALSPLAEAVS